VGSLVLLAFRRRASFALFSPILLQCKLQKFDNEITELNQLKRRPDPKQMRDSDLLPQGHRGRP
jgi:hypothetical protein